MLWGEAAHVEREAGEHGLARRLSPGRHPQCAIDGAQMGLDRHFVDGQGAGDDDVSQSDQRNQQIQTAFDSQRFQRGMAQNLFKALSSQSSQIAELRQRQAQQKT